MYEADFEPFLLQRRLSTAAWSEEAETLMVKTAEAVLDRRAIAQGFESDPVVRREIERYAMSRAAEHFAMLGYSIADHSASRPYDLLCEKDQRRVYVEVKGTATGAEHILLTRGEVEFNRRGDREMALFIQRNVRLTRDGSGEPSASAGDSIILWPWVIEDSAVLPITLRYIVPRSPAP